MKWKPVSVFVAVLRQGSRCVFLSSSFSRFVSMRLVSSRQQNTHRRTCSRCTRARRCGAHNFLISFLFDFFYFLICVFVVFAIVFNINVCVHLICRAWTWMWQCGMAWMCDVRTGTAYGIREHALFIHHKIVVTSLSLAPFLSFSAHQLATDSDFIIKSSPSNATQTSAGRFFVQRPICWFLRCK